MYPEDTYPVLGDVENLEADPRDAALTGSCGQTHGKLCCTCNGVTWVFDLSLSSKQDCYTYLHCVSLLNILQQLDSIKLMLASLVLVSKACECASRTAGLTSAHKVTILAQGCQYNPCRISSMII